MPPERTVRDAKINFSQLNQVILVGGTARIPPIRKLVTRLFGRIPTMHLNPDEVIAQGAAIQATFKTRHSELRDVVTTDVCPYTLGVDTSKSLGYTRESGYFTPIIKRNRSVPCSRVRALYTVYDQQAEVDLKIYQGKDRMVADNILPAELPVSAPSKPADDVRTDVRFTYDTSGTLDVDTNMSPTGAKNSLVIGRSPGVLAAEQIQQSLSKSSLLRTYPRDERINQVFTARLDNLYQLTLTETRDWISNCSRYFSCLLEKQDSDQLADFRAKVELALDSLERECLQ